MERVVDTIFNVCEDDIRSLNVVSQILSQLAFFHGVTKREYESSVRVHKVQATVLDDPLSFDDVRNIRRIITGEDLVYDSVSLLRTILVGS